MLKFKATAPDLIKSLGQRFNPSVARMQRAGNDIVDTVVKRTRSGRDERGRPFKPYSAAYAKSKGSRKVDLTDTGAMLDDLGVLKVTSKAVKVGNKTPKEASKAAGNERTRKFMGIMKKELGPILRRLFAKR